MGTMKGTLLTRALHRRLPQASDKAIGRIATVIGVFYILSFSIPLFLAMDAGKEGRTAEAIVYCALTAIWILLTVGLRSAMGFLIMLGGMAGFERLDKLFPRHLDIITKGQIPNDPSYEHYDYYSIMNELILSSAISALMIFIGFWLIVRSIERKGGSFVRNHSVVDDLGIDPASNAADMPIGVKKHKGKEWSDDIGLHSWR